MRLGGEVDGRLALAGLAPIVYEALEASRLLTLVPAARPLRRWPGGPPAPTARLPYALPVV